MMVFNEILQRGLELRFSCVPRHVLLTVYRKLKIAYRFLVKSTVLAK